MSYIFKRVKVIIYKHNKGWSWQSKDSLDQFKDDNNDDDYDEDNDYDMMMIF